MLPAVPATSNLSSDSSDSGHEEGLPKQHHHHHHHEEPFVNLSECTSVHEGRQLISTILPVNIDTLFQSLYGHSKFLDEFHASRKLTDIKHTEWTLDEENRRRRTFKFVMPIKSSFGPKTSSITELQSLRECSVPGSLYSIDITSYNENVPYADTFTIYVHHCLVRTVDDHTMFSVFAVVKFRRSVFIRALIEKTTYSGIEDFHNDLALQLSRHFCSPPARHKRHIRSFSRSSNAADLSPSPKTPTLTKSSKSEPLLLSIPNTSNKSVAHNHSATNGFVFPHSNGPTSKHPTKRRAAMFILFFMVFVSILNVVLYLRLLSLSSASSDPPHFSSEEWLESLRWEDSANFSSDDWIRILVTHEQLHQQRVTAMRRSLIASIDSIQKTEKQLMQMVSIIAMPKRKWIPPTADQIGNPMTMSSSFQKRSDENAELHSDL